MANRSDYMMGHSTVEAARLDEQHVFFKRVTDDHLLAPQLQQPVQTGQIRRILDVGTGTGIWCHEAATHLHNSGPPLSLEIVGIDIAASDHWQRIKRSGDSKTDSTTITFEVVDLNDDAAMNALVEKHGPFDLVHSRMVISAIKDGKWLAYLRRAYSLLRPGGYIQLFEADMINTNTGRPYDPTVAEALVITHCVYRGMGLDPEAAVRIATWLHEAGFVAIRDMAYWCYPTERKDDGRLEANEVLQKWHLSAYQVLRPLFFKLRFSPGYAQLLDKLPPQAMENSPNGRPEDLLSGDDEYDDFLRRHEDVVKNNAAYRTVFRVVLGRKP